MTDTYKITDVIAGRRAQLAVIDGWLQGLSEHYAARKWEGLDPRETLMRLLEVEEVLEEIGDKLEGLLKSRTEVGRMRDEVEDRLQRLMLENQSLPREERHTEGQIRATMYWLDVASAMGAKHVAEYGAVGEPPYVQVDGFKYLPEGSVILHYRLPLAPDTVHMVEIDPAGRSRYLFTEKWAPGIGKLKKVRRGQYVDPHVGAEGGWGDPISDEALRHVHAERIRTHRAV